MGRWGYFEYFKPSRPRAVKGGIRAQSKGGKFGESWWAKRWISVLESFNIGARLGRGRSYARSGQVLSIETDKGRVRAKVQGSRPKPYEVTIQVKALSSADWQKAVQKLSKQAIFMAKLLAGEMPQNIEEVFKDARLSVFPEKLKDLTTECSCPDWSNPCKHIAAVYYLLGEEFDRDPFLIFKLRGMSRDEFLRLLGQGGKKSLPKGRKLKVAPLPKPEEITPPGAPLAADIPAFWEGNKLPEPLFGEVRIPPVSAALPKRLGNFPFWRGEIKFLEAMETIYPRAAACGLDLFLGTYSSGPMEKGNLSLSEKPENTFPRKRKGGISPL
jgi:uncharacterized Zn finger protein